MPKPQSTWLIPVWMLVIYMAGFELYGWFSYSLTDPNLVLSSWSPYWQFQTWMWQTFFTNSTLLSQTYALLISALLGWWGWLLWQHRSNTLKLTPGTKHRVLVAVGLLCLPLLFSYNALSHDVFNYLFNAKMVVEFQANPHVQVALDFAEDDWTRFMRNTHTPAPYGYGWTALSLAPYLLGFGKFITTWISFRLASILSLFGLVIVSWWLLRKLNRAVPSWALIATFFNPLLLIEIVSNSHNDLWMMVPAIAACGLLLPTNQKKVKFWQILVSAGFLGLSISTKLATLVLVPLWLALLIFPKEPLLKKWWPLAASWALFVPLLTLRSQQFHPWYLTWLLVWIPVYTVSAQQTLASFSGQVVPPRLSKQLDQGLQRAAKIWTWGLLALTASSLYRYLPWLLAGGFNGPVLLHQKLITWIPFGCALILATVVHWRQHA